MQWTLVTGGSKRLGANICIALANQGCNVLIHYKNSSLQAKATAASCRQCGVFAETLCADFSSIESIAELLQTVDKKGFVVNHLINNVGPFLTGTALETSLEEWMHLFQTTVHAPFMLIKGLIPVIKSQKGSIINIGTAGILTMRADVKYAAYTIAKRTLYTLTKSLAKELAVDGVRVNMVSPGETEISLTLSKNFPKIPMKRPAKLKEVIDAVLFLMAAPYITGQNLEVAGGLGL